MATTKEEGADPDFLRMDQPVSSDPGNAKKTGNWHGWPTKEIKPVTVATYQVLATRRKNLYPHLDLLRIQDWGLVVYDEVHLLPAPVFRMTAEIQARRRLGLTATLIREDGREADVFSLIGPKRFDVPWRELEAQGWVAAADCVEVGEALDAVEMGRPVCSDCGDGTFDVGEQCDDGDVIAGDGCESDCTITPGCQLVAATDVPTPIPDEGSVASTIVISSSDLVSSVQIVARYLELIFDSAAKSASVASALPNDSRPRYCQAARK